jgi:hypothetical protein
MPPTKTEHRIGLRFNRTQARALHDLAERARHHDLTGSEVSVFHKAALAAESGEPLIIVCVKPIEAILIAKGYANYGITEPVIEQLA